MKATGGYYFTFGAVSCTALERHKDQIVPTLYGKKPTTEELIDKIIDNYTS